jgi:chemotaxis protein CheD
MAGEDMEKTIGLGELVVSSEIGDVLKTYALATCVGITAYSPIKKVAGMAHIVLPAPYSNIPEVAKPAYYATKGVPLLIQKMCHEFGCLKRELTIHLFGGADSKNTDDVFKVGNRNLVMIEQLLEQMSVRYQHVDTGGNVSRTIEMDVTTGKVKVTKRLLRM